MRAIVLATSLAILAFCGFVLLMLRFAFQGAEGLRPLAAGWLLTFALMSLLTAEGPWVDPIAYTRAFTECYVVGCLVVAGCFWSTSRPVLLAGAGMLAAVWLICIAQLKAA